MASKVTAKADALKSEGNNFFKNCQYKEAIEKYQQASQVDPTVPAYFSNAAACWEKLGNYEKMAEAGRNTIKADPSFVKGYFRLANAQKNLNQLRECFITLENGLRVDPSNADLTQMKNKIFELQRKQDTNIQMTEKPDTWSDCDEILVEVPPDDDQYWQVAVSLQETMTDAHISKLWRIQNTPLWNNYSFQKVRLSSNNIMHNERSVWHGTSSTDPAIIYNDKLDGFMMQISKEGYWGRGIYFADKSIYSHTYSHKPHLSGSIASATERPGAIDSDREMFLTKLLVGNEVVMNRDESPAKAAECKALKFPPIDPKTNFKYNTVTGHTDGSQVWIVYENFRAYPDYLVRYYRGERDLKRTPYKNKQEAMNETAKKRTSKNAPGCPDDTGLESGFTWEYEDNDGWKPYSDPHQAAIENAYQLFEITKVSKVSTVQISTSEWEYEVDVASMAQTNIKHASNRQRNVRRRLSGVIWEYEDNGGWKPYSDPHQAAIENAYQMFEITKVSKVSTVQISTSEWEYDVDVASMVQTNIKHASNRQRNVRRRLFGRAPKTCVPDDADSSIIWEFMDDDDWKPYSDPHQVAIESVYQSFEVTKVAKVSTVRISTSEWEYEVDVASMVQKNMSSSNRQREVRRRLSRDGAARKSTSRQNQHFNFFSKYWK